MNTIENRDAAPASADPAVESGRKRIFGALFVALFASVIGNGIVVPLLPVYARDLGASGLYIGLIIGAFSFSRVVLLPFFGRISDKKGRKPLIVGGLLAYTIVSIAFMLFEDVHSLMAIRLFHGVASAMVIPVAFAYVGDIAPKGREGYFMGLFNVALFLSLSFGPILGGVVKDGFGIKAAFLCMSVFALISLISSLWLLPPAKSERISNRGDAAPMSALLKDPLIIGPVFVKIVFTASIGIIWCTLPILCTSEFHLSSSVIGLLVMLNVFIAGVIQAPMGSLADKVDKRRLIVAGGLIAICATVSLLWANTLTTLVLANLVLGFGGGMANPSLQTMVLFRGIKAGAKGSAMGLFGMGDSLGMLVGSILAGAVIQFFDIRHSFSLGSAMIALGLIVFLICAYTTKQDPILPAPAPISVPANPKHPTR